MESTTQLRTWIWHLRFYVFISNCVIAVVYKPYCHYYIWQLKHLVTSKRIKTCLVFILKGQYPMAVRCKSVSQTATSFTPKSHIWFSEHSFIESNCHSFPSKPSCPDSLYAVTRSVLSYSRVITALHQHTELLRLICFCTLHALMQVLGAGLLSTFSLFLGALFNHLAPCICRP